MRILILANNDGGLYKFRLELLQKLVKSHQVYISLPNGDYIERLEKLGCVFIDTPINRRGANPITDFKLLLKYKSIINNVKPDVVLTYTIKPNVYGGIICSLFKIPYLTNITGLGSAVENAGVLQKITLFLYKISLKKAFCVFFQNKENQQFFIDNKIIKDKNRLIPGSGVNLEHFSVLEYPDDKIINFLYIGRMMKEKGIDQFIDAAEFISDKYKNTQFHVIGYCEEDYKERLEGLQKLGVLQFHGIQDDVIAFHKISHCTIHPTYYPEGMSNVLLESASCGRPIITTNRSGCREILEDTVNGFFVKQKNSDDLIKTIEMFLNLENETRKTMGLKGREKVEKEFDRNIIINAYIQEIEEIKNKDKKVCKLHLEN